MASLSYPGCIRRLYESEVNGEAIYSALLAAAETDRDRYHFATLLQLETETKAWLQPFLFKHKVAFSQPDIRQFIDQAVKLYKEDRMKALMFARQVAGKGLSDFEEIAAFGPEADQPYLRGMVEHEKAILNWISGELQGVGDASLADVIAKLRHPISRP